MQAIYGDEADAALDIDNEQIDLGDDDDEDDEEQNAGDKGAKSTVPSKKTKT